MKRDITKNKVAVLVGGWSDEADVSRSSGREVARALREAGFTDVELLDVSDRDLPQRLQEGSYDVAFIAMHGKYGEDGCIQGLLEILHIPYTFSGVLASSMAMEKDVTKVLYRREGLPVANDMIVKRGFVPTDAEVDEIVERLGLPLFVKPSGNGSSFGITRVTRAAQLADAIELATKDGNALVEEAIEGMEVTVPVIGNEDPEALPIIEIVTGADFYDIKVKYEPSEMHHVIPARISEETAKRLQEIAVRAHVALGCRGCSRSDFILREDGTPVILETNTIPGMTAASLMPDSARHAGISFPELCRRFVAYALEGAC